MLKRLLGLTVVAALVLGSPVSAADLFLEQVSETVAKPIPAQSGTFEPKQTQSSTSQSASIESVLSGTESAKNFNTSEAKRSPAPANTFARLGLNVESILQRGDIRASYEKHDDSAWSMVLSAHVNPHETYNDETGMAGLYYGPRLYLGDSDVKDEGPYVEILGGLDYYSSGAALGVDISLGYQMMFQDDITVLFSAWAHRGYQNSAADPNYYITASFALPVDDSLIPFL